MWTYSTNLMGPFGLWWYEQNEIPYEIKKVKSELFPNHPETERKIYLETWFGGRIDCYCNDENDKDFDPYGQELPLPIMKAEHYSLFSDWLENIKTNSFIEDEKILFEMFEKEKGITIEFFK